MVSATDITLAKELMLSLMLSSNYLRPETIFFDSKVNKKQCYQRSDLSYSTYRLFIKKQSYTSLPLNLSNHICYMETFTIMDELIKRLQILTVRHHLMNLELIRSLMILVPLYKQLSPKGFGKFHLVLNDVMTYL